MRPVEGSYVAPQWPTKEEKMTVTEIVLMLTGTAQIISALAAIITALRGRK